MEQRDAWWRWVRAHCLADDTYWHIERRFYEEPDYAKAFYRQNVSAWFLRTLAKRRALGAVNIIDYGQQRSAKSRGTLYIANRLDPTFAPNIGQRIFFRLSQLERALERIPPNSIVVCDEVRKHYGVGSQFILRQIANFLETKAVKNVSVFFDTPTLKLEEIIHGLFYAAEYYGYDGVSKTSMAMVYSIRHRLEPIGLIFPGMPPDPVEKPYQAMKDAFCAEDRAPSAEYREEIDALVTHELWPRVRDRRATAIALAQVLFNEYPKDIVKSIAVLAMAEREAGPAKASVAPVQQGQPTRAFLLANTTGLLQRIITLYRHPEKQESVAEQLNLDSAARVSELLNEFTEGPLGDLYEIWCKGGESPAKEGEVDGWEDGLPTNYKATYQRHSRFAIGIEKLQPELQAAEAKGTPLRVRAYNVYWDEELHQDVTPQELRRTGSVVFHFGTIQSKLRKPET